ncbi:endonuclease/exonuclease/phosphatase family protein [Kineococcus terrestris]|uniref:endonuclease/exonuclease/phosphatase family protein n=1 Tax=Kineococcus terrestris TaxID=2044856 RepID=UPI0034DAE5F8
MQEGTAGRRPRAGAALVVGTAVSAAVGAAVVAAPHWWGLGGTRPFAWAVSFRLPLGLGLAGLAGLAGLLGLSGPRGGSRRQLAAPVAAVLGVAAAGSLGVTLARGLSAGSLPPAGPADVTVVAANVRFASADRDAVAGLVVRHGADAVSLPEADLAYARDVAARVAAAGGPRMQVLFRTDRGDGRDRFGTALLVTDRWGPYRDTGELDDGFKAVVTAAPVAGEGPVLAAAHTAAPVSALLEAWRAEVAAVADWCGATPDALVAGDLNATLDHPGLAGADGCVDAGRATGTGARGTWPQRVPAALGAGIDHVLGHAASWEPAGTVVADLPGSDHRAVVARWRPVAAPGTASPGDHEGTR